VTPLGLTPSRGASRVRRRSIRSGGASAGDAESDGVADRGRAGAAPRGAAAVVLDDWLAMRLGGDEAMTMREICGSG